MPSEFPTQTRVTWITRPLLGVKCNLKSLVSHTDSSASIASLSDVGYRVEKPDDPAVGTSMEERYRQYKEYDVDAKEAEQEYKQRLKEIPWAPKKERRTEDYYGI